MEDEYRKTIDYIIDFFVGLFLISMFLLVRSIEALILIGLILISMTLHYPILVLMILVAISFLR